MGYPSPRTVMGCPSNRDHHGVSLHVLRSWNCLQAQLAVGWQREAVSVASSTTPARSRFTRPNIILLPWATELISSAHLRAHSCPCAVRGVGGYERLHPSGLRPMTRALGSPRGQACPQSLPGKGRANAQNRGNGRLSCAVALPNRPVGHGPSQAGLYMKLTG